MSNLPIPSISRIMEMTAFKTEKLAIGALKTLKWLDAGAPHKTDILKKPLKFDMTRYVGIDYEDIDAQLPVPCGTACCLAGAIQIFGNLEGTGNEIPSGRIFGFRLDVSFGFERGDYSPLSRLFYPMDFNVHDVTVEEAATTFRNYLFSGEVKWR